MPDQEPYRATLKSSAEAGRYLTENIRQDDGSVVTYIVPANVTEAEWQTYPAEVKKLVRDAGLHDVQTDEEARTARAAYAKTDAQGNPKAASASERDPEPPASQDKTAALGKSRGASAKSGQE